MSLYSYIVGTDAGFAPNPFHGVCTLVCCKPVIRRTCAVGDWIAGLTPKFYGHKLVYAMKVGKKVGLEDYWRDPAYKNKRVNFSTPQGRCGDNIYEFLDDGTWKQHPSLHSRKPFGNEECVKTRREDLSGEYALIADEFVYYGASAVSLPEPLAKALPVGRGYRCKFAQAVLTAWEAFMQIQARGVQGNPLYWDGKICGECATYQEKRFA